MPPMALRSSCRNYSGSNPRHDFLVRLPAADVFQTPCLGNLRPLLSSSVDEVVDKPVDNEKRTNQQRDDDDDRIAFGAHPGRWCF